MLLACWRQQDALNRYRGAPVAQIVTATVSEMPDSKVSLACEVNAEEFDRAVSSAAKELGSTLRVPGFRKGKVPAAVVMTQIGRENVVDRAIRSALGTWYAEAIAETGIDPVGDPRIEIGVIPEESGQPLPFTVEVGVRPPAKLGKYKDLKVPREEPNNGDDRVEEELERMVAQAASLEPTEDPAAEGDSVVVDYVGAVDGVEFDGGKGSDQLIELGAGRLIPGFEEQLIGVVKDEKRTLNLTFPEDYPAENLAGKDATFDVTVQEVRAKSLPELDDQFAEQLGHDSVADLRQDIKDRLTESEERRIDSDFRAACVDAAAENAKVELTDELIEGRARELWERTLRSMEAQGINRETYLQISGKSEEEIIGEAKEEAATGLRREATLEAVVNAEGIDPTEEQMLEALEHSAGHEGVTSAELLERIRNDRREDALKSDLASRLAVDLMVESAKPVAAPRKAD